jgi:hypothetical protein
LPGIATRFAAATRIHIESYEERAKAMSAAGACAMARHAIGEGEPECFAVIRHTSIVGAAS